MLLEQKYLLLKMTNFPDFIQSLGNFQLDEFSLHWSAQTLGKICLTLEEFWDLLDVLFVSLSWQGTITKCIILVYLDT